jgi:hypothetical protein
VGLSSNVFAVPALQLYMENSSYDPVSETWIVEPSNFNLWVLGDVGQYGGIYNVMLVTAFDSSETGTISFTPLTTAVLTDPSTPGLPIYSQSGTDNAPPFNTGTLPAHSIYGPGVSWNTYQVGDFTLTDSPIGDYMDTVPVSYPDYGQINVYNVNVTGYSWVHFDAFDHYVQKGKFKYVKAPFSHDGQMAPVPEPASVSLLGIGLLGLFGSMKKKR